MNSNAYSFYGVRKNYFFQFKFEFASLLRNPTETVRALLNVCRGKSRKFCWGSIADIFLQTFLYNISLSIQPATMYYFEIKFCILAVILAWCVARNLQSGLFRGSGCRTLHLPNAIGGSPPTANARGSGDGTINFTTSVKINAFKTWHRN